MNLLGFLIGSREGAIEFGGSAAMLERFPATFGSRRQP
jgi:hypothetical protein